MTHIYRWHRTQFGPLHPGLATCPECDRPVGDYHHADCSQYPKVVRP